MSNIVDAYPREGVVFRTKPMFQWDYGQIVRLHISDLPATYKVEFSNSTRADAVSTVQNTDEVTVPAQFLESGNSVYAWVVVVDEARTTEYSLIIPVSSRAKPTDLEPSPEEHSEIEQALSALNHAVEQTAADVEAAGGYAEEAELCAEAASSASENAIDAKEAAIAAKNTAETKASEADTSALNASTAAQNASMSASQANISARNAASSASAAETAKNAAQSAAQSVAGAMDTLEATIQADLQAAKESGEFDGKDGTTFTPTVSSEGVISWTNDGGKTNPQPVNIKGPQGDKGATGPTGQTGPAGAPGISPSITIADITGGHRVTITDATGQHSFDVMDGEDGQGAVQDVQVNGTSVVTDGVANVPKAGSAVLGVAKIDGDYGVAMFSGLSAVYNDKLYANKATDSQVKAEASVYRPIVPSNQHLAAFYGLAKAAGADMASSSNPVGTYTEEAKIAIQKMLGVYEPPWELLNDITLTEEGRIDLTADANGTPYDLLGVYIRVYYDANLTTASTGYARYLVEDSDGTTLNTETGKYTTQTTTYSKFVYILRDGPMAIAVYSRATATGGAMVWQNKHNTGAKFDFKNIQRIYLNKADVEPAGTRIQIYGQRAYSL